MEELLTHIQKITESLTVKIPGVQAGIMPEMKQYGLYNSQGKGHGLMNEQYDKVVQDMEKFSMMCRDSKEMEMLFFCDTEVSLDHKYQVMSVEDIVGSDKVPLLSASTEGLYVFPNQDALDFSKKFPVGPTSQRVFDRPPIFKWELEDKDNKPTPAP